MEVHDRRLSISKASASKISKPSSLLKGALSATPSSSANSSTPSPPRSSQLPSSITSSPSRPIAKVVNADPSSFRRVVQELTGTATTALSAANGHGAQAAAAQRAGLSRLQRVAPPPLRSSVRILQDAHHHQHRALLEQMQHHQQQQQASQVLLQQQGRAPLPQVGSHLLPPSATPEFGNRYPANPRLDAPTSLSENPNFKLAPSLPMLSPHLLSPLPALTPGDNSWANPIEAISQLSKPNGSATAPSSPLPPLLPLPNVSTGRALLVKPQAYTSNTVGYGEAMPSSRPTAPLLSASAYTSHGLLQAAANLLPSALTSHGLQQAAINLPPLLPTPSSPWFMSAAASSHGVLPPWSPSPIPFSPGLLPLSPGMGPPPPLAALQNVPTNGSNPGFTVQNKLSGSMFDPNMPQN